MVELPFRVRALAAEPLFASRHRFDRSRAAYQPLHDGPTGRIGQRMEDVAQVIT